MRKLKSNVSLNISLSFGNIFGHHESGILNRYPNHLRFMTSAPCIIVTGASTLLLISLLRHVLEHFFIDSRSKLPVFFCYRLPLMSHFTYHRVTIAFPIGFSAFTISLALFTLCLISLFSKSSLSNPASYIFNCVSLSHDSVNLHPAVSQNVLKNLSSGILFSGN